MIGVWVVEQVEQGGGGGSCFPGLSVSPAHTGDESTDTNTTKERKVFMGASATICNQSSIQELVAVATAPVGEEYKDYWAKRAREGDLWAYNKLARCYERTGEFKEGRDIIDALLLENDVPFELRIEALLTKAVLQKDSPESAWKTINGASLEVYPHLRGRLHNQRGRIQSDRKKTDAAIMEFTGAAYYFELAEDNALLGHAYNNVASMYRKSHMFSEAHESVDKAIDVWREDVHLAHALDTKALIYIDEKNYRQAREYAASALLGTTEDRRRWRAEFLGTLAKAEAGLSMYAESVSTTAEALGICDYLDDEDLKVRILLAQKAAFEIMYETAYGTAVRLALNLAGGNLRQAAKKIDIAHPSLLKVIKKHSLKRK